MKRVILFLGISLLLLGSCSEEEALAACGYDNPIADLDWLRAEIAEREANPSEHIKYAYITKAKIKGIPVIVYRDCNPLALSFPLISDCSGNRLNESATFLQEGSLKKKLYGNL
jgi:hypothetical protein